MKKILGIALVLVMVLAILPATPVFAAGDRYWVGTDMNWHDANNWSTTSGGAGGAGVPTASDDVYFDANGNAICWPTSDIVMNNLRLEATCSIFLLMDCNVTINGDFYMGAGYFGPTGGPDHIIEMKGDYLNEGGTFAVGTGTGVDPTVVFSGTDKTYFHDNATAASYQNVLVSGTLTASGTRLGIMNITQRLSVTGTFTVNANDTKVCDIDIWGSNAGFGTLTGTINGTGRIWYRYQDDSTMPDTGTISIKYFRFYLEDATATLPPRTFTNPCEVEVDYQTTGQVFSLEDGGIHEFYKLSLICDESGVTSATFDCATYDANMWVNSTFDIEQNSFPNATVHIDFGDDVHVFKGSVDFYFQYSSANAHLDVDAGEGTLIMWAPGRQLIPVPPPGLDTFRDSQSKDLLDFEPIPASATYRLSRIWSGGVELQDYYQVIAYNPPFTGASGYFLEGFNAYHFVVESYAGQWSFRMSDFTPYMMFEFDRFTVIGYEGHEPTIRERLSLTPEVVDFKVNDAQDIFGAKFRYIDASAGITLEAYNSVDLGNNVNIEFYDRDTLGIPGQRNILNDRSKIPASQAPESITRPILERIFGL